MSGCGEDCKCRKDATVSSPKKERPSWDIYLMNFAELAATKSTCLRRQCGAAIVKEKHVLTTGYNGAPSGLKHCGEYGCLREELKVPSGERHELCRGLHAEQNAIIQAAKFGISTEGATLYVTDRPCSICTKMLINVGIKEIVMKQDLYPDELSKKLFEESGIKIRCFIYNSSNNTPSE